MKIKENILKKIGETEFSGAVNMLIKPIGMIISIIYTPLLLAFLGNEKYGLWATVLSIINWINYFDAGIGNGLRNLLSKEVGNKQYNETKKSVSTAYGLLMVIAGVTLTLLVILTYKLDWYEIFSTTIDMKYTLLISFTFICINFVLALSNMLLYALQKAEVVLFN